MEVECSSEMLVPVYQITRRHIPEDCNLVTHICQNIKSQGIDRLTASIFIYRDPRLMQWCVGFPNAAVF